MAHKRALRIDGKYTPMKTPKLTSKLRTDADHYRERLLREINLHCGCGATNRPATKRERYHRACWLWERALGRGQGNPPSTSKDVISALVDLAYPKEPL